MAAFNPVSLVTEALTQPASAPVWTPPATPAPSPPLPPAPEVPTAPTLSATEQALLHEQVLLRQDAEARLAAEQAQHEAALAAQQAAAAQQRQAEVEARRGELSADLGRGLAQREATLTRDQATRRARAGGSGIRAGSSASFRALLDGLQGEADADAATMRRQTAARLDEIRRGVEGQQRSDLLAMADLRRRNELARAAASAETAFAARQEGLNTAKLLEDRWQQASDAYVRDRAAWDQAQYDRQWDAYRDAWRQRQDYDRATARAQSTRNPLERALGRWF